MNSIKYLNAMEGNVTRCTAQSSYLCSSAPAVKRQFQHLFVKGSKYFEEILLSERATASKAAKVPEGEVGI